MKHAFRLPYLLFLLMAIVLIILSFFSSDIISINFHDTYYVLTARVFVLAFIVLFLFFWIAYSAGERVIYKTWLIWLHFVLTVLCTCIILSLLLYGNRHYFSFDVGPVNKYLPAKNRTISIALIVLVFSQLVFLTNMIVGLIRKLAGMGDE
jgi:hypothetical protein